MSFAPCRFSEFRIYLTLSSIKQDDFTTMVFMSDEYGTTWNNISSNIPHSPVNVILENPEYEDALYSGAFNGNLVSDDRGQLWKVIGKGMQHSLATGMTIMTREKDLSNAFWRAPIDNDYLLMFNDL